MVVNVYYNIRLCGYFVYILDADPIHVKKTTLFSSWQYFSYSFQDLKHLTDD